MILESIRLHPFAGTADRTVQLAPGLNVIVGPNEAGKSTLVTALRRTLFTTTHLTPSRFKVEMQGALPVSGGDTIRVTLAFNAGQKKFVLEKCWSPGRSSSSRLCLPEGGELTDAAEVETQLRALLKFTEGTYHNVLVTYQSHLSGTVEQIRKDPVETTAQLADLLRRSVFQSDGVSVDKLMALARAREEEYFGRWDRGAEKPEGGRDIDRPWKQGTGIILQAYYEYRRAEQASQQADAYERKIDEYAARMRTQQEECAALAEFVQKHRPFVDDARKRAEITALLDRKRQECAILRQVSEQWPRAEEQLAAIGRDIDALLKKHAALSVEFAEATEFATQRVLRERFAKATVAFERHEEEAQKLASLRSVSEQDLKKLRDLESALRALAIKQEARRLALSVEASTPFHATLRDGSTERRVQLGQGERFESAVSGHLSIDHSDWRLTVRPAGQDAAAVDQEFSVTSAQYKDLCLRLDVASLEEAAAFQKSYEQQKARVDKARSALDALTDKEPYEAFARRIAELPAVSPGRLPDVINAEMGAVKEEGGMKRGEQQRLGRHCEEWATIYGDAGRLLDLLVTARADERHLEQQLASLQPLPEGVHDAGAFVASYERTREQLEKKKQALHELAIERKEFEKTDPGDSLENLREELHKRKAEFASALAHGKAYTHIREKLTGLLDALDRNTSQPLQRRFESLVEHLTLERYKGLEMEGLLPVKVKGSGRSFPLGMLSQGTLDVLALAVRLGMAEYYLEDSDGFIVMDDPMVNLDPDRQKAAAGCLQEFARRRQAVVLTCHPSHAHLLGGHLVKL